MYYIFLDINILYLDCIYVHAHIGVFTEYDENMYYTCNNLNLIHEKNYPFYRHSNLHKFQHRFITA